MNKEHTESKGRTSSRDSDNLFGESDDDDDDDNNKKDATKEKEQGREVMRIGGEPELMPAGLQEA